MVPAKGTGADMSVTAHKTCFISAVLVFCLQRRFDIGRESWNASSAQIKGQDSWDQQISEFSWAVDLAPIVYQDKRYTDIPWHLWSLGWLLNCHVPLSGGAPVPIKDTQLRLSEIIFKKQQPKQKKQKRNPQKT